MKIGILTSDFRNHGALPADELFAKIKNHGFEVAQLNLSAVKETEFTNTGQFELPAKISDDVIGIINDASHKYGIPIIICNGTFNMAHPDAFVRDEGVKRFELFAGVVKQLGCGMISLCSGTRCENHMWTYHEDNNTPEAWNDMIDAMKKVTEIAEKHDVIVLVETEASNIINTPEKARQMMDEINSPKLKMIMDCANLFHAGEAKKENVHRIVRHAFDVFGGDIIMAHGKDISESDGINFCPTGEGIIDFKQFGELLNKYNYKGDMLLHGIFDENKMAYGIETIKNFIL